MNRPTDHDAALEAELAALVPAAPSADLRRRVAEALAVAPAVRPALPGTPAVRPVRARWLAERLLWACGGAAAGAIAASVAFAPAVVTSGPAAVAVTALSAVASPAAVAAVAAPVEVAEESVAWADAGVQFIDDQTPARVLRRVAVERHRPAGGSEYRVPREDVILLPVALR